MEIREIKLDDIVVSEFNTRKDLDAGTEDTSLDDLASSIRERGLLNPITVRSKRDGKFDLIAGQRRFLACRKIGWETIPSIIRDGLDDTDATIISLIENVHRADMNPIDKAKAYRTIYEQYGDYAKVAKETGVSVPTVRRYLRLLELTPSLQERLSTAEGPAGVGTLSRLAEMFSPEDQEEAYEEIRGFRQDVQFKIIRESGGNLEELASLRDRALEGVFEVRTCIEGLCFQLPEASKSRIKEILAEGREINILPF